MTEAELTGAIERSKVTALKSIRRHLPHDLDGLLDDIVQETYLRYYMTFRDSRPLSDDYLHRWIYVAARNESLQAAAVEVLGGWTGLQVPIAERWSQLTPARMSQLIDAWLATGPF